MARLATADFKSVREEQMEASTLRRETFRKAMIPALRRRRRM
jgi:hypothetical protein